MSESIHEKLNRLSNRRRGCHAGYDDLINEYIIEIDGEKVPALNELPFIVGAMGDFSGNHPTQELKPLSERRFIEIDRDNFNIVMNKMTPGLSLEVNDTLSGEENKQVKVTLAFESMDDFEPANIVKQFEPLRQLMETRNKLQDLTTAEKETTAPEDIPENELEPSRKRLQFTGVPGLDAEGPFQTETREIPEQAGAPAESLLDQAIAATRKIQPDRSEKLPDNPVKEALKGTISWDRNVTVSITDAIKTIDASISKQLAAVMHDPEFLKLEGSWRGLNYLVMNSETGENLKIQVLNISKKALFNDLKKAPEFGDQSEIYKKVYTIPYGALIGDYEFTHHPDDMALLRGISRVSAAAFAPFLSAAAPEFFGFDNWTELTQPRDLAKISDGVDYIQWKSFRDTEDSRFVVLALPRTLARLPYGSLTQTVEAFAYEEAPLGEVKDQDGKVIGQYRIEQPHDHYCWMNTAYALGTRLTDAFAKYGWCTAIRGEEGGGKVENLPSGYFISVNGIPEFQGPMEVGIDERREFELDSLGFLPLLHYKNTDFAVFFSSRTTHKPKKYDRDAANANAAISAHLPYILATSRFAHYLKVIGRRMIRGWGSPKGPEDIAKELNRWIMNYVMDKESVSGEMIARYPLREAKIDVEPIPGKPGSYNAVAWLRPWLPMVDLSAALRVVVPLD